MKRGFLSEYFIGVVAKRLSMVETDPDSSNQHEFNGVRELKTLFGEARLQDCTARFIWLGEENEGFSEDSSVTWYDARENHPTRTEHRLYFKSNPVMEIATANDLLVVAKRPSGELLIVIVAQNSTVENQLLWLFGISQQVGTGFEYRDFENGSDVEVDFAVRFILEELGVEVEEPEADKLDALLEPFQGDFPTTAIFSTFARNTLPDISPLDDPDTTLLTWMDREEKLFRRLERHKVAERLRTGFWSDKGADVDGFIKFSLSVQNRRKSRTGYALENHLEEVFKSFELRYDRQAKTENNAKPDFLFPGEAEYQNPGFSPDSLSLLGVKSTCKDRWRQVLSEAQRIPNKHLLTLEPGISENQTLEMQVNNLQLVLPAGLHETYRDTQRDWLMNVRDFITHISDQQS